MAAIHDPEFDALLGGAPAAQPDNSAPVAAVNHAGNQPIPDPEFDALLNSGGNTPRGATPHHVAPPPVSTPARTPTRFQQARTPSPDPELTWSETFRQAGQNLGPSAMGVGKSLVDSVMHPLKTLDALGQLGAGAVSQAQGAMGVKQDPAQAARQQAVVRALENHYAQTYGSVKGFKQAASKDPASIAMDASTFLDGAGLVGRAAGVGKLASGLSKAAEFTDPVQLALKAASVPVKGIAKVIPHLQSFTSGASTNALRTAARVGADANPEMRAVFRAHMAGEAPATDLIDAVRGAIRGAAAERSAKYVAAMKEIKGGILPPLDWTPVQDALARNRKDANFTATSGAINPVSKDANDFLDEAQKNIDFYSSQPAGDVSHTLEGFDSLKRTLGDVQSRYTGNRIAYQKATDMYNSVLDVLKGADPEYANVMEGYGHANRELDNLSSTFIGRGRNPADEAILRRIMSAKNSETKQSMLGELAQRDPRIPYMLAGRELQNLLPDNTHKVISSVIGAGTGVVNPLLLPLNIAAASPRLMGKLNETAGAASRLTKNVTQPAATKGAYYAGRTREDADQNSPDQSPADDGSGADEDAVFERMLHIESGKSQFDRSGNTKTSPKGALGISQVMPTTGPLAARLAGEEWSLDRLKNDPAYNRRLGRAYYNHLKDTFGDPLQAAAAYNAGPARVRSALTRAGRNGNSWVDNLPRETQAYVRNIETSLAQNSTGDRTILATGGAAKASLEHLVDRLMARAEKAKMMSNRQTKPLMKLPDEAIVRALEVAQNAI